MSGQPSADEVFVSHRPLLFSIAYEILGSVADTEDVLQESYLRWRDVDHACVTHPRAYLAQTAARQALMSLRSASRRREQYIGPWLPEPLATVADPEGADGPQHVLSGEAVTTAMLLVFETLTPEQRVVFVLREVFDFGYDEIALAVGKSKEAVRQINHRAHKRVNERRPSPVSDPARAQSTIERAVSAVAQGDINALMEVLSPEVVALVDGGGVVSAARGPVNGSRKVAQFLLGLVRVGGRRGEVGFRFSLYNGLPAVLVLIDGEIDSLTCIEVRNELIVAGYCVRNPAKLLNVAR